MPAFPENMNRPDHLLHEVDSQAPLVESFGDMAPYFLHANVVDVTFEGAVGLTQKLVEVLALVFVLEINAHEI
jgi:hypothetical protein